MPGHEEVRLWFPGKKLDPNIQAHVDRCRIPQERLTIGKQLGKGNFGLVYKGQLITPSGNMKTVAIKSLKGECITLQTIHCKYYKVALTAQKRDLSISKKKHPFRLRELE